MKTIIVIYTNEKKITDRLKRTLKHYSFVTDSDVKEGDRIRSASYTADMVVVKVIDEEYKYYNSITGELSNNYNSTSLREIKKLVIREEIEETVYATLVKED